MSRSLEQSPLGEAFASLADEVERVQSAFQEAELYYRRGAAIDLDAYPQMGLEALTGLLQRMDALARTLRGGALEAVDRVWQATQQELQTVHERQVNRTATRDRERQDHLRSADEETADTERAADEEERRQVNDLLRDAED